jgi:hypothetical protein
MLYRLQPEEPELRLNLAQRNGRARETYARDGSGWVCRSEDHARLELFSRGDGAFFGLVDTSPPCCPSARTF